MTLRYTLAGSRAAAGCGPAAAQVTKLRVLSKLRKHGEYRADFESALTVADHHAVNLTAGLTYRYDSDSGRGVERGDTLFIPGMSVRMD